MPVSSDTPYPTILFWQISDTIDDLKHRPGMGPPPSRNKHKQLDIHIIYDFEHRYRSVRRKQRKRQLTKLTSRSINCLMNELPHLGATQGIRANRNHCYDEGKCYRIRLAGNALGTTVKGALMPNEFAKHDTRYQLGHFACYLEK